MRKIVFDIETSNIFTEVGSADPAALDIAVVGIYDSETDSYSTFLKEDLHKLWPILEHSDMLIGFYSEHFDLPLLNKYYPGDLSKIKQLDILKEIRKQYGRGMSLDKLAEGTLGKKKSGHGLEATKWWKQGEYDKVRNYCLDDVRITKELYDHATTHNKLIFKEGNQLKEVKLDTSEWEMPGEKKLTFSMGF
ncbi:ribonuclease H-like domain-containing protein [Candidatus Parcubacteria bacterium]|nr:ribonuclease H-like domain-containing protein [Candidatus Parcubacteria bacterium]